MQKSYRSVLLLSLCQALLLTHAITFLAASTLVGFTLAPTTLLATLPVATLVIGGACTTLPASLLMKRSGRKNGFTLGMLLAMLSALVCAVAIQWHSFPLFCVGTAIAGMYNAVGQYYRFAAADVADSGFKAKAISLVLAGGILGGILGPGASKLTRNLGDLPFQATFASLILFALLGLLLVRMIEFPAVTAEEQGQGGRPLKQIARQPAFMVACLSAVVGYGTMNLLMSATPLAMKLCGFGYDPSADVIRAHVIGMFLPSFFTGSLIKRFGVLAVMLSGNGLMLASIAVGLSGQDYTHFLVALVLLGTAWNFMFIGGTTLLTESYSPAEKAKTQGLNDLLVFGMQGITAISAGIMATTTGWHVLNFAAIPLVLISAAATAGLWMHRSYRKAGQPSLQSRS